MSLEQQRIFISYSRQNKDFAVDLAKELKASGFSVWLDVLDISTGSRWDDEVEKALATCGIFMVILTPTSAASDNVKDEIGYAIDHDKRIVPVLLENSTIPLRLRRFQYVDFTSMSYEDGVESAKQLLSSLGVDRSHNTGQVSDGTAATREQKKDKPARGSGRTPSPARRVVPLILGTFAGVSLLVWGATNLLGLRSDANPNTIPTAYVIEFDDQEPAWDECYSTRQDMNPFGGLPWREADHLFGAGLHCSMGFQVYVYETGIYRLALYATYAPDFGILGLSIERGENSQEIFNIDLYDPQVRTTNRIDLGDWELNFDQATVFSFDVVGKNAFSSHYKFGLDYLTVDLVPLSIVGRWDVVSNNYVGELKISSVNNGVVSGSIFDDRIDGTWDESKQELTFRRSIASTADPGAHQIHYGILKKQDDTFILSGYFEQFTASGKTGPFQWSASR